MELELDEELLLEELDVVDPPQLAAAGLLPVKVRLSILAKPLPLLACRRKVLVPACRLTFAAEELLQLAQAPVPLKARFACDEPFTSRFAERALEPFA